MNKHLDNDLRASILDSVDKGFARQLDLTRDVVRIPSLRGQEHTCQDYVFRALRDREYAMDRWSIDIDEIKDHPGFSPVNVNYDNAINVVATHHPREEVGRSLILNGHIDVVPEGPTDMWESHPFDPVVKDGWLYGRGSGDMKAGLVANIFALDALRELGYQPASTVHIQSVTEEECTGNGALSCLARGYTAEAAIIPEPEDDMLVRANVGVIWFQVQVRGKPVHVRETGAGANAIEACFPLVSALRELEEEWNTRKVDHRYFEELAHPINLNIGKFNGGDWASSVPAWATFDCRISIYPGEDPRVAAAAIEERIEAASRSNPFLVENPPTIEWNGFFAEGYVLEEGSEAEETLARAHAAAYGSSLESFVTPGYLDGRVFALYDDCKALVYGPYSENIHGFNERVCLSSLKRVTGTIALFVADWCKLEPCR